MRAPAHDKPDLELALLRRGMHERAAERERCTQCGRTPLIGEWVYVYEGESILCALCRAVEQRAPTASRLVHGPEFGHTIKTADQRAA